MRSRCTAGRRGRLRQILRRLTQTYGPRPLEPHGKCLDLLVQCMLAQNTNMANADSGYRQLRRAFASWTAVMNAPVDQVQRCIAVCGLARMRARRLQALLRTIKQQNGRLDLQFLGERPPHEAFGYLTNFFGIGPKTASCTLLFAFNMPLFPVDRGIHRTARRLTLVRAKAGEAETALAIQEMIHPRDCYSLHLLMFKHAKTMCRPRNPKCAECPLLEICRFGLRRIRHRPPAAVEPPKPRRPRPIILSRVASAGIPIYDDDDNAPVRSVGDTGATVAI